MLSRFLTFFGLGRSRWISGGTGVRGRVNCVRPFWGIKVKTRPVLIPTEREFPYRVVTYTYPAGGRTHTARSLVSPVSRCPQPGEEVTVFYCPRHPDRSCLLP